MSPKKRPPKTHSRQAKRGLRRGSPPPPEQCWVWNAHIHLPPVSYDAPQPRSKVGTTQEPAGRRNFAVGRFSTLLVTCSANGMSWYWEYCTINFRSTFNFAFGDIGGGRTRFFLTGYRFQLCCCQRSGLEH